MIPRPTHPLLPRKMVLGGLPWVAVLISSVLDAHFAVKEADAASSNLLPMAHQPTVDLLSLIGLHRFHGHDAQIVGRLAEMCHLLLHLLLSLSFVMQLFFELLNATKSLL